MSNHMKYYLYWQPINSHLSIVNSCLMAHFIEASSSICLMNWTISPIFMFNCACVAFSIYAKGPLLHEHYSCAIGLNKDFVISANKALCWNNNMNDQLQNLYIFHPTLFWVIPSLEHFDWLKWQHLLLEWIWWCSSKGVMNLSYVDVKCHSHLSRLSVIQGQFQIDPLPPYETAKQVFNNHFYYSGWHSPTPPFFFFDLLLACSHPFQYAIVWLPSRRE